MKVFDDDGMFTPQADELVRRYASAVVAEDPDEVDAAREAAAADDLEPVRNVFDDIDVSMALALALSED